MGASGSDIETGGAYSVPPCGGETAGRTSGRKGKPRRRSKDRSDLYQTVTDQVIADLEAGTVPWVKPWDGGGSAGLGLPENASTGRGYSGINILLLWAAAMEHGRSCHVWLTYRQAQGLGAQVRKGERGTTIVHAGSFTPKEDGTKAEGTGGGETDQGSVRGTDTPSNREVRYLKRYTVFHVDQVEGLEGYAPAPAEPVDPEHIHERAEALIAATGADISHGGDSAYYMPGPDRIQLPHHSSFTLPVEYYVTGLHELCHWTGHASRLDRNLTRSNDSKDYAREELVAEMGAAFLCAAIGVTPALRHADYLASWLEVLREDKRAIFKAASLASKASDFILEFEHADLSEVAA